MPPPVIKTVSEKNIDLDSFIRGFWNRNGSKAAEVIMLPDKLRETIIDFLNVALIHGFESR